MEIPPEVMKCVVFIGYRLFDGTEKFAGSGFLLHRSLENMQGGFNYVVTAGHVVEGIRKKGLDKVLLRVNQKSGTAVWIETSINDWNFHPDEEPPSGLTEQQIADRKDAFDLCVLQLTLHEEYDHFPFPLASAVTPDVVLSEEIGVGNEVCLTGLFHPHHGQRNNIPIVRVGNIAAMLGEKVKTRLGLMDAYLIEARSIGGLSGSPVFLSFGHRRSVGGFAISPKQFLRFYILGVMHGHFDLAEDDLTDDFISVEDAANKKSVNMGIAIVVPIEKVLETIRQPKISKEEDEVEKQQREKTLTVMDSIDSDAERFTQQKFEADLKKVSRKIDASQSD
jgi:Trypsin-like peptidase domain